MRQRLSITGGIALLLIIMFGVWWQFYRPVLVPTPIWNGVTPAQTTQSEVIALFGEPDDTWFCYPFTGESQRLHPTACANPSDVLYYGYAYKQLPTKSGEYEIHFNADDIVDYVVASDRVEGGLQIMSVEEILTAYGRPERVLWSWRGMPIRGLLYCEQGFMLHAMNTAGKEVWIRDTVYFAPLRTEPCIDKLVNEVSTTDPNGGMRNIYWVQDPWGFNEDTP